jgi:hypothetical protein
MVKTHLYDKYTSGGMGYHKDPSDNQTGTGPALRHYDNNRTLDASGVAVGVGTLAQRSRDIAVIKAHSNISKPDVQGLVTAAELQKTIDMLRNPMSGLRDWFRRLHQVAQTLGRKRHRNLYGHKNDWTGTLDVLQNTWLEWRYGWRPLIYEVQGIQKALNHQLTDNGRARSRGYGFLETSGSGALVGGSYQASTTWSRNISAESWSGVIYDYNLPQSMKYQQLLGLYDLPTAGWELVPYSFVVDWAVNIGEWLRAITPTLGVSNRHCWVTTTVRDSLFIQLTGVNTPNPATEYYNMGGGHTRQRVATTITRANGSVPTMPPVNVKLDTSKVLDLIFLIRGYGQGISNLRL